MNWNFSVSWVSYFWMFLNIQYHLQLSIQTIYRLIFSSKLLFPKRLFFLFIFFYVSFSAFFVRQLWIGYWLLPEWCSLKPSLRLDEALPSVHGVLKISFSKVIYTCKGDKRRNDWLTLWASCSKNFLLLQGIWALIPFQLILYPSPLVWWKCFRRLANPICFYDGAQEH